MIKSECIRYYSSIEINEEESGKVEGGNVKYQAVKSNIRSKIVACRLYLEQNMVKGTLYYHY
jgi:hypothetical protein